MTQISEPLIESKAGITEEYNLLKNGERVGCMRVGYIQKDEVKSLRKYTKRNLTIDQPFGVQVFIDTVNSQINEKNFSKEGLHQIVVTLKDRFKGLEERDIFILELNKQGKTIVGRGNEF